MKLFLSGGGSKSFSLDEKFIESLDKSKPILYIPIAMDVKSHSYEECFEWIKGYFSKFNFDNIKMETDLKKISKKDLDKFSGVYIGGGNTPYLLNELKKSGFYENLKYLIKKDIPLAGGSAGAIIFAKTIIPSLSCDKNKVGLKDFKSLNKLKVYDLWAHYDSSMDKIIKEYMKKYNLKKIIALPETCGIYVNNKDMEILGEHSAYIFNENGKREIKIGEKFL